MPKMLEIYKDYAVNYDDLLSFEDYSNNLTKILLEKIDWQDKVVYEAGIGTGRVTKIYIDKSKHCYGFDREDHMMEKCRINLTNLMHKITLSNCENLQLRKIQEPVDIFIEGWSFGHTIIENSKKLDIVAKNIINNIIGLVKDDGKIIIIESAGTNSDVPFKVTNQYIKIFLSLLEEKFGFKRNVIETDYVFPDYQTAARVIGFFFGEEMRNDIISNKKKTIKEFTGVWILEK